MTTSNDTILLVGHGSREASGNAEILLFAERWRARHPDWRIEVGFIEFADPLLDPALNHAARNSERVLVLPLILNAAGHVRQDIPSAIQRARKRHPDVQFLYAPHLAVSDPLLRILKRFLRQAMLQLDVPDPRTTGVILLGRGSSDRLANGDVARMARWLWESGDHERVLPVHRHAHQAHRASDGKSGGPVSAGPLCPHQLFRLRARDRPHAGRARPCPAARSGRHRSGSADAPRSVPRKRGAPPPPSSPRPWSSSRT